MTLKTRRVLSLIFIILFLLVTPAIIFYAAGYKLKKNSLALERTGIFVIDSDPEGAKILLNGQTQKTFFGAFLNGQGAISTPAKIKNLLPGEYKLALKMPGYIGWEKKLTIEPGLTTMVNDIYLFKDSQPVKVALDNIQSINFSPNKTKALIIRPGQISFLDLSSLSSLDERTSYQKGLTGKNYSWSASEGKALVDNRLYDLIGLKEIFDFNSFSQKPSNFKWEGDDLYYVSNGAIYKFEADKTPIKIIDNLPFNDYLLKGNNLYLISRGIKETKLKTINLETKNIANEITLPVSGAYNFINDNSAFLNIYGHAQKKLYLIDTTSFFVPTMAETINNVTSAYWPDKNTLFYLNDFEIWLYDLKSRNKTLATRISDKLSSAYLHPSGKHIIYSTQNAITSLELDERDKKNTFDLLKAERIDSFVLSPRGDNIYFFGKNGNNQSLYKAVIH